MPYHKNYKGKTSKGAKKVGANGDHQHMMPNGRMMKDSEMRGMMKRRGRR